MALFLDFDGKRLNLVDTLTLNAALSSAVEQMKQNRQNEGRLFRHGNGWSLIFYDGVNMRADHFSSSTIKDIQSPK